MAVDRHRIWREVSHIYDQLEKRPRESFQPVVEAYVKGRDEPVVVALAETRREPDYPWVKLYMGDDDGGYVFVHEDFLERVEVTFRSTEVAPVVSSVESPPTFPSGFRAVIADDDSA